MARKKSLSDINAQLLRISNLRKSIQRSAQIRMRNAEKKGDVAEFNKQYKRSINASKQSSKAYGAGERYKRNIAGNNDYWFSPNVNFQRKYAQSRYMQGRVSG